MWNCERVSPNSLPIVEKNVDLSFQSGFESDRVGTASVDLAHLRSKRSGELICSLALFDGISTIEFSDNGLSFSGGTVDVADNGFIRRRLIPETWQLTVVPE